MKKTLLQNHLIMTEQIRIFKKIGYFLICSFVFFLGIPDCTANLIISQYYEGSSNNKWIEITNVGASSETLSGKFLCLYANSNADNPATSSPNNNFVLTGSLAAGASLLFQHSSAALPSYANGTSTSICNFNGNDLVIISTSQTGTAAWANRIDVVGNGTENWGQNTSFYRDAGILSPNTTFTLSEWVEVSNSTVDNASVGTSERLGEHVFSSAQPVTLSTFTAKPMEKSVKLEWVTQSEDNNDYFSIEHSVDGRDFEAIGMVEGKGVSSEIQNYSFMHEDAPSGIHYYRLRQVDFDGSFDFSPVVTASLHRDGEIQVMPTLANNHILINANQPFSRNATYQIINSTGQIILQNDIPEEQNNFEINVSNFPTGNYFLRLVIDNQVVTKRFLKK